MYIYVPGVQISSSYQHLTFLEADLKRVLAVNLLKLTHPTSNCSAYKDYFTKHSESIRNFEEMTARAIVDGAALSIYSIIYPELAQTNQSRPYTLCFFAK